MYIGDRLALVGCTYSKNCVKLKYSIFATYRQECVVPVAGDSLGLLLGPFLPRTGGKNRWIGKVVSSARWREGVVPIKPGRPQESSIFGFELSAFPPVCSPGKTASLALAFGPILLHLKTRLAIFGHVKKAIDCLNKGYLQ